MEISSEKADMLPGLMGMTDPGAPDTPRAAFACDKERRAAGFFVLG